MYILDEIQFSIAETYNRNFQSIFFPTIYEKRLWHLCHIEEIYVGLIDNSEKNSITYSFLVSNLETLKENKLVWAFDLDTPKFNRVFSKVISSLKANIPAVKAFQPTLVTKLISIINYIESDVLSM